MQEQTRLRSLRYFGHSDIRMTARYTHATDEAKRRAVEKLVTSSVSGRENEALPNGRATAPAPRAGGTPAVPVHALSINTEVRARGARFGNVLATEIKTASSASP